MIQNIPIFIINLTRDLSKKMHMESLCNRNNLQFQFTKAVDGRKLGKETLAKIYSSEESIGEIGRELAMQEIGCALSHINIYKHMVEHNLQCAIVFEDDITISGDINSIINAVDCFPNDWGIVLLGYHGGTSQDKKIKSSIWYRKTINSTYSLVRLVRTGLGTHGYIIHIRGAKKLIAQLSTITKPIDHYTGVDNYINMYAISPRIVKLERHYSANSELKRERSRMRTRCHNRSPVNKIKRELIRPLKRVVNSAKLAFDRIRPPKKYH